MRRVPVADHLAHYAIQFARRTRVGYGDVPDVSLKRQLGRRPAGQPISGARPRRPGGAARPLYVSGDDIRAVALPVLRHRIVTNFNAEAEGIQPTTSSPPDRSHSCRRGRTLA